MYENAIVRENIQKLTFRGYHMMKADSGELACKSEGVGRLPELSDIVERGEIDPDGKKIWSEKQFW